ncbi:MAG: hypothetical protein ACTSUG_17615 [Candidatus Helarchaeota archaeon]
MKKTLLIAAIALVITAGTVSLVDAQMREKKEMKRPEFTAEMKAEKEAHIITKKAQYEKVKNIVENGTYEEWKNLVENKPGIIDLITKENFEKFKEAWKLKHEGNYEEAKTIMGELGINKKFGIGMKKTDALNKKMFMMKGECPF